MKTYHPRQRHTSRSKEVRIRGQLRCQHAIFDRAYERDQVVDFLPQGQLFEVLGFVRVDGLDAGARADRSSCCA